MTNGDDLTVQSHHGIGIEIGFEPPELLAAKHAAKPFPCAMIEGKDDSVASIVLMPAEVMQYFHEIGRNATLLDSYLSVSRKSHDASPLLAVMTTTRTLPDDKLME